jgi:hypothetical protein
MRTAITLVMALGIGAGISTVSAREQGDGKKYDKGSTVTLQGCVVAAEKKDTFVLTNVREWPIGNSDMGKYGKRYYWIDKNNKDFRAHAGHTIQIVGKISDVEKSEIDVKSGESGLGTTVEVEGPGKDVKTTAENAQVGTITGTSGKDIPITLLKLKVEDIKMTSATCSPM